VTLPDGVSEQYSYDRGSELTGIAYVLGGTRLGGLSYFYDPDHNRTAVWGSSARTNLPQALGSATYNADNELTARDGQSFSYDANGNLTGDGTNAYGWNARNQLTSLTNP